MLAAERERHETANTRCLFPGAVEYTGTLCTRVPGTVRTFVYVAACRRAGVPELQSYA